MTNKRFTDGKDTITKVWEYYEAGKRYNNRLVPNQYTLVDTNIEFYAGNQWVHLPMTRAMANLPKPVFNIIKRITNVQVANIISGGVSVNLEPLAYYDESSETDPDSNACEFAQAEIENLLNKFHFDYRVRDALFDGAVTGDYCAHMWFDPTARPYGGRLGNDVMGEIMFELVDGINVMVGNPNSRDIQSQPYVLLIGRDTVKNLTDEAKRHSVKDADRITHDSERHWQSGVGGKIEILSDCDNDKAIYGIFYQKVTKKVPMLDKDGMPVYEQVYDKDGRIKYLEEDGKQVLDSMGQPIPKKKTKMVDQTTVHVSKATRDVMIYEDIDTGLDHYPVAWNNWEHQKNQYHGRALVTGIISNQIFINQSYAMAMKHLQQRAFPKYIFDADKIPHFTNELGVDIAVHNVQPGQNIAQLASILPAAEMSSQIMSVIDMAMQYTKDCLGSTDAQLGSAKADNTSALMMLNTNSQTPLDNPRANVNEWTEDIVMILLDMMATYYGKRPIVRERTFSEPVMDSATGSVLMGQYNGMMQTQQVTRKVIEAYDFSKLKHLYFSSKIEVGTGTPYSEAAVTQILENLRAQGVIEAVDYLERMPDKMIPRRMELIQKLKKQAASSDSGVPAGMAIPQEGGEAARAEAHTVLQQMNPEKQAEKAYKAGDEMTVEKALTEMPANVKDQFDGLPARAKGEVAKLAAERLRK